MALHVLQSTELRAQDLVLSGDPLEFSEGRARDPVAVSGSFTQMLDFDVPEYFDIQPQLGLSYSSAHSGFGDPDRVVGRGWGVSGVSSIRRHSAGGGAPFYQEDQDVFYLDGQALLACKDTNATNPWPGPYPTLWHTTSESASCSSGGNFVALQEDYRKIIKSVGKWEIWEKDGSVRVYHPVGYHTSATAEAGSDADLLLNQHHWLLTEVQGAQSDYHTVIYNWSIGSVDDGFSHRLADVTYGAYEIKFNYEFPGQKVTYGTGTGIFGKQGARLASVEVKDDVAGLRAYRLDYQMTAITSQTVLVSVREYGSDYQMSGVRPSSGSTLPEYGFEYSQESFEYQDVELSGTGLNGIGFDRVFPLQSADFDNDGRDEAFFPGRHDRQSYVSNCAEGCHYQSSNTIVHGVANYVALGFLRSFGGERGQAFGEGNQLLSMLSSGVNERQFIGITPKSSNTGKSYLVEIENYLQQSKGLITLDPSIDDSANLSFGIVDRIGDATVTVDVGRFDFERGIHILDARRYGFESSNWNNRSFLLNDGQFEVSDIDLGDFGGRAWNVGPNLNAEPVIVFDLDGNGLTDLLHDRRVNRTKPGDLGNDFGTILGELGVHDDYAIGDFNGDGMQDVVYGWSNKNDIDVYLSSGKAFLQKQKWASPAQYSLQKNAEPENSSPPVGGRCGYPRLMQLM